MTNSIYTQLRKEYPRTWRIFYRMNKRVKDYDPTRNYLEVNICPQWDKDLGIERAFQQFLDDMGPCEDPLLSIDRINTLGDYEPSNCRWADSSTQANNTIFHTTDPRGQMVKVAKQNGISRVTYYARIQRGWNINDAATLAPSQKKYKDRLC